jgi:hypothetical protein
MSAVGGSMGSMGAMGAMGGGAVGGQPRQAVPRIDDDNSAGM